MSDPKRHPCEDLLAHAGWIRGVARELVLDDSTADDVVQQTWLAAIEKPPPAKVSRPRAWLAGIVRNLAKQGAREQTRRASRERRSAQPEKLPSADELVAVAELQKRVVQAVLDLREPYRATLLLRYFEDLVVKFPNEEAGFEVYSKRGCVIGETKDGLFFKGCDNSLIQLLFIFA